VAGQFPSSTVGSRFRATSSAVTPHLIQNTRETGIRLTQAILAQFGLEVLDQVLDQVLEDWHDPVFNRR
jgi:hypothetical protein